MNHCSFLKGNICPVTFCGFKSLLSIFYCFLFGSVFQILSKEPCEWVGRRRGFSTLCKQKEKTNVQRILVQVLFSLSHPLWEGSTATQLLHHEDQWHLPAEGMLYICIMFKWAKHKNPFFSSLPCQEKTSRHSEGTAEIQTVVMDSRDTEEKGFFFSLSFKTCTTQHKFRESCPLPEVTKRYFLWISVIFFSEDK